MKYNRIELVPCEEGFYHKGGREMLYWCTFDVYPKKGLVVSFTLDYPVDEISRVHLVSGISADFCAEIPAQTMRLRTAQEWASMGSGLLVKTSPTQHVASRIVDFIFDEGLIRMSSSWCKCCCIEAYSTDNGATWKSGNDLLVEDV